MVEAIWDSIPEDGNILILTQETKEILDKRLDAHQSNQSEGSTWEDVKSRIKNQL
jgi:putative addiction module component (TIGR02574 family)